MAGLAHPGTVVALGSLAGAGGLAGCAAVPGARATDAAPPTDPGAERIAELAPGVYMRRGLAGEVDPTNLGRVGNSGFIVGPAGVMVIDAGTSAAEGESLLAAIRARTDRPIRLLLLTQTRQEFLFGAPPFHALGVPIHMHRAAALLMQARCENCLKTLRRVLGDEAMRGSAVPRADVLFDAAHSLDGIGRPVRLLPFGLSSGPGHTAVLDLQSGVLFAGGLLDAGRIPDVQDGQVEGWRAALQALRAEVAAGAVRRIVPGHGPATSPGTGPALIDQVERYLVGLDARTRELALRGVALSEVGDAVELPEFAGWDQADTIHRRNASVLYLRHERELLLK